MKIGLVSPYDWSYPGGVRDHVWHLAEQLISMGHDTRILAPASGIQGKKPEKYILKMGGTTPIPINGSIARINLDPSLSQRVRAVLQRERFDVIHVHEPLVPGLSQQVLRSSRTLTVGTFHTASYSSIYSTSQLAYASAYPLLRPLFYKLSGCIAVSTAARQFISRYFPADYRIIPNGISLERFGPGVPPLPHLMDGKQNILFVGRFEKRKGAKYLLRAIPAIREQHPHTRFIFVGEGRLRPGFQRYVERQGWQDVIFTGYVSDEEKPRYFASAHVFCAPAIGGESLGIVLLEAMASGVAIVASDIMGYATVVTQGVDGLLTAPRQPDELAGAISYLLTNEAPRQQFIQAGLLKARDYAWTHVARSVMDYYCELLDARARASRSFPRAL
jgi:phosphatidyl-myo-inositol alpha-mannosyltransferase